MDLDLVIRRHQGLIKSLCRNMSRDMQLVEEIEAETYLRLAKKWAYYDPSKGSFGAWVGRVIVNVAVDIRRNRQRHPPEYW